MNKLESCFIVKTDVVIITEILTPEFKELGNSDAIFFPFYYAALKQHVLYKVVYK